MQLKGLAAVIPNENYQKRRDVTHVSTAWDVVQPNAGELLRQVAIVDSARETLPCLIRGGGGDMGVDCEGLVGPLYKCRLRLSCRFLQGCNASTSACRRLASQGQMLFSEAIIAVQEEDCPTALTASPGKLPILKGTLQKYGH